VQVFVLIFVTIYSIFNKLKQKRTLDTLENFHWTCPYCNRDTTITESNISDSIHIINNDTSLGKDLAIITKTITCPNTSCKELVVTAHLKKTQQSPHSYRLFPSGTPLLEWSLRPNSAAKPLPGYIPAPIKQDYEEACKILSGSAKASATLSRRCLQGMIRDFWNIKKSRLIDEIKELKEHVDPITWGSIDAIRKIGNIGAHMEQDINLIIDVEPQEAQVLIELIEMLIKDWYIDRHERQQRHQKVAAIISDKDEKKANKAS